MVGLLNVGSLILGLVAWILPIINILNSKKDKLKNYSGKAFISMTSCMVSVYCQLLYNKHLVNIEDWSAIMDTMGSTIILSGVTILLNGITLFSKNKTK